MATPARSVLWPVFMVIFGGSFRAVAGRGVVALALGCVAAVWPFSTLRDLTTIFGLYAVADGIMALAVGLASQWQPHRWLLALDGAVGIGFGVTALVYPPARLHGLAILVAIWAIASEVLEVAASVRIHGEVPGDTLMLSAGAMSIVAGVYIAFYPARDAEELALLVAGYSVAFGTTLLLLAIKIRGTVTPIAPSAPLPSSSRR